MGEPEYVVVFQAETAMDAEIGQAILEEAGIPVVARPAGETWERLYFGPGHTPVAQLLVPAAEAQRARVLLREYQQHVDSGAFALPEEDEEE